MSKQLKRFNFPEIIFLFEQKFSVSVKKHLELI